MNAIEIVKDMMKQRGVSQSKLAELTGFKRQSNITGILNRGTGMRVDNLIKMSEAMGYEVIIVDKNAPETVYKVTLE